MLPMPHFGQRFSPSVDAAKGFSTGRRQRLTMESEARIPAMPATAAINTWY
jgi:hypothetical protein